MPVVDDSVTINAPAEKIFAFLVEGSNIPVYDSSCTRCEQEGEGAPALGMRLRGATKLLGKEFDWVTECTEFEPGKAFAVTSVEGKLSFRLRSSLSAEGEATRLDYHIEAESGLGGVFGRIADPLVTKAERRQVKANLGTLKDLMESDAV